MGGGRGECSREEEASTVEVPRRAISATYPTEEVKENKSTNSLCRSKCQFEHRLPH